MAQRWTISNFAGTGDAGYAGDGGPALQAQLNNPFDLAFDPAGNLLFSDTFNHCLRRIEVGTGIISTIAALASAVSPAMMGLPRVRSSMSRMA